MARRITQGRDVAGDIQTRPLDIEVYLQLVFVKMNIALGFVMPGRRR